MAASERDDHRGPERGVAYALPGGRVAVYADDSQLLDWLDEFLGPGLDRVIPAKDDPTVVVTSDAARVAAPAPAGEFGTRACFALDREVVEHPARLVDGTTVITDSKYGAIYRVEPDMIRVVRDDLAPRSRAAVMRVVRELATAGALADGSRVELHASALAHVGRIIVLAGPKEAGKTTLMARLASVGKFAIAGNDRLLVTPSIDTSGGWRVRPIPTVVNVRPDTRALLPGLFGDVPAVWSPAHLTVREFEAAVAERGLQDPGLRLKLSLAQFAGGVGVPLLGDGELASVLLISVDPTLDGYAIEPLTPDAARQRLGRVRYGSRRNGMPRTVFEEWLGVARPPAADGVLLGRLAESVVVATLRVGPRVLHDEDVAAELLGNVLAHA